MSTDTVAEVVVDHLVKAGVKRIYGIVGDSLNPISDALRRNGKIAWVHVRHEEVGAFAAGAEAQLSGELAVCAGSSGPGNLHLINGLFDAHRSHAPVLALASHIPGSEIGTQYFQETHPDRLFAECSHYSELIANPAQMPRVLQIAMQTAVSRRGVSVVALPGDVAAMKVSNQGLDHDLQLTRPKICPNHDDVARLAEMINTAGRVTLFCGAGCEGTREALIELADKIQSPIGHAWRGKQWVEPDNSFDVGMTGFIGFGGCYEAMHNCDLLILLGTDFPYHAFMPTQPKIAQVDICGDHLGRRSKLDLGIIGDVGATIAALLPLVEAKSDCVHLKNARDKLHKSRTKLDVYIKHIGSQSPLHPEYFTSTLNRLAVDDAVFTVDTGLNCVWAARYIQAMRDRRIIGSFNHGSMACALPQAIGAQFLYPDRQVIAMCGDGGFSMLMGDLLTIASYDLPVKVIVYNNGALGFISLEMRANGLPDWQTEMKNPNFAQLAEVVGIRGIRIEQASDVESSLKKAMQHKGPVLIDVVTDPNVISLPPNITLKEMEGFSLGMSRLALSGHIDAVVKTLKHNWRSL